MQEVKKGAFLKGNVDLLASLRQVLELVEHEETYASVLPKLKELELRLLQPLRLLIIGEFNAGKSSIVNTLLQNNVVKTNNIATTAINTMIEYGEKPEIQLFFEDGSTKSYPFEDLDSVTAEIEGKGKNFRKQLQYVRLFYNASFLKDIVLVDSPGLNSHHLSHTEQTMSMIPKVDDAIWVFLGGGAGRNTEQQFLKDMVKQGIQPFGVINRIDEVDDYIFNPQQAFENDQAILGENVRGLLPVSALEAQYGYLNNSQEDLEASGFLPFVDKITKMKQNEQVQLKRQRQYGQNVYTDLLELTNNITAATEYEKSLQQLSKITYEEVQQFEQYEEKMENEKAQADNFLGNFQKLNGKMTLKAWLNHAVLQENKSMLPNYNIWKGKLDKYECLMLDIQRYERKKENFLISYENYLGTFFNKYRHLFAKKEIVKKLKSEYQLLQHNYENLMGQINSMNKQLLSLIEQLSDDNIQQLYQHIYEEKLSEFTNAQKKYEQYEKKAKNFHKQLENIVQDYLFLKPLHKQLVILQRHVNSPTKVNDKLLKVDMTLGHLTDKYQQKVESLQLKFIKMPIPFTTLELPSIIDNIAKMPRKMPVFLRPISMGVASLVAASGIVYGAMQINWTPHEDTYDEEGEYFYDVDEQDGMNYLSYSDQGEGTGYLEVGDESVSLYHAPNFDRESDEYLPANSSWEVYEVDGDWYRIQDEFWVHADGVIFEDHIQTYVADTYHEGIATLIVNNGTVNMYDGASTDDRLLSYLVPGNYTVTHISERKWAKIDDYGWVELTGGMELDQYYLNENNYSSESPLRTVYGNADDVIPVFNGPSRDEAVIGFIEGNAELQLFEIPNGEWGSIGQNIWVELDKYFFIDWEYSQNVYGETPIGTITVMTDVLNVRNKNSKDGSLLGILHNGDVLDVYDYSSETGWFRVGNNDWVSNRDDLVKYTPAEQDENANGTEYLFTVETFQTTPIYFEPYLDEGDNYATIDAGNVLEVNKVYNEDGTWYEIIDIFDSTYFVRATDVE